jgi:hypothetical protein
MKEINADLFLEIVNDMTCIHNQLMEKEYYSAGSNFNRLQQTLVNIYKDLLSDEKGPQEKICYHCGEVCDEEVQEQEECETECEEEKAEIQEELDTMKREWILQQKRINQLEDFIKHLLKSDHIYKPSIEATLLILKKENETIEQMTKYLPGTPIRLPF